MTISLPFVSVLCATYRRPQLVRNSLACFLAQDYPASHREMLILDDGGDLLACQDAYWQVEATTQRFPSTAAKYRHLSQKARGEVLVVWDDDDVYLPWHISVHVASQNEARKSPWDHHVAWSKPFEVNTWTRWSREITRKNACGCFHGATALTRCLMERVGGWRHNDRADWSLEFLAHLQSVMPPCNTLIRDPRPGYLYRWHTCGVPHASDAMKSPDDENWYQTYSQRIPPREASDPQLLTPEFDEETLRLYHRLGVHIESLNFDV